MGKAIGYTRVSTDEQAAGGLGLAAQRSAILAAAAKAGVEVTAWYSDDGVSGGADLAKRAGLLAAVDALAKGDMLIVAKRDRLARDSMLAAWLDKEATRDGWRIVSAAGEGTSDDDPASVLMRRIGDAFAEYERRLIAARTSAALQEKRRQSRRAGTVPFGFDLAADGDTLTPNPTEQAALATMRELRAAGMPYRAICAELANRGYQTKNGGQWQAMTVRNLCATR